MGWKIGGSVGKFWEQNKGTVAGLAGGALGAVLGGPAGAAVGYGLGSTLTNNKKPKTAAEQANESEMASLQKERTAGLESLKKDAANPYTAPLNNSHIPATSYTAPVSGTRDSQYLDKATAMQRPSGVIANDAIDELRGRGEFNYADRAPNEIQNDALDEIRNFRSGQGSLASQYATGGYPGGGGAPAGSASVGSRDVAAMTERANVDELMAFDPQAAFEKYVTGAQGQFDETLKTNNERLTQTAAGGGRLNTGFFDLDRGELGRQLSADARNSMQQKALDTNQQKLSAITSGTGIRADDLNALRQQYLEAETGNADRSLRAGQTTAELGSASSIAAADRDANFRAKALGIMGDAEDRSLSALDTARGYQVGDQKRRDDIFTGDRAFKRESSDTYNENLKDVGVIQRADRDRDDDIFSEDRDYYTGLDETAGERFESDRDYEYDAWKGSNDVRYQDQVMARGDQSFNQGVKDNATNRWLDMLAGNSDRAQAGSNAIRTDAANRENSRNQMLGGIVGAGLGSAKWKMPSWFSGGGGGGGGVNQPSGANAINREDIENWQDQYSPDAIDASVASRRFRPRPP